LSALAAGAEAIYWLAHENLDAAELKLAPDLAALVATRRFPPDE
jgi:hypothetical protein